MRAPGAVTIGAMGDVGYRTACNECGHLHCCIDSSEYFLPCRLCNCELRPDPQSWHPAWEFAAIWTDKSVGDIDWSDPPPRLTPDVIAKIAAPGSALAAYIKH
jgi:hypothetical protein